MAQGHRTTAYMAHLGFYFRSSLFRSPLAASGPGASRRCEYRDFGVGVELIDAASAFPFLHFEIREAILGSCFAASILRFRICDLRSLAVSRSAVGIAPPRSACRCCALVAIVLHTMILIYASMPASLAHYAAHCNARLRWRVSDSSPIPIMQVQMSAA